MSPKYTCYTALAMVNGKGLAKKLSNALENLHPNPIGIATLELNEQKDLWEVGAYFDSPPDKIQLHLLSTAFGAEEFKFSKLEQTDWVAKVNRSLKPIQAGKFWVYFAHTNATTPQGLIGIQISSSMAFGTGHHGTTQGCLKMLSRMQENHKSISKIVDVGCGSGILSIAAKHLWESAVVASDIDQVAVEVARENIIANHFEKQITAFVANGLNHTLHDQSKPYDLVIANILLDPLIGLAEKIKESIQAHGFLVLSGIMTNQEYKLLEQYKSIGFSVHNKIVIDDWVTLKLGLRKP